MYQKVIVFICLFLCQSIFGSPDGKVNIKKLLQTLKIKTGMAFYGTRFVVVAAISLVTVKGKQDDWSLCPSFCKCKWVSGRKTAECINSGLSTIPNGLSPEIQMLDLSGNSLYTLPNDAFSSVKLVNLQKIYLKQCSIKEVHKDAFKGLQILIELDLSDNRIHSLSSETFRDNVRLRVLIMDKNPIRKLEDGLFTNLTFLQIVEMRDCELAIINHRTFYNVPKLENLILNGNNLSYMKLSVVQNLKSLKSLVLHNNPWRCDCHLRNFRDWLIENKLYSQPTSCAEPLHLQNKLWNEIPSEDFACKPQIQWPPVGSTITSDTDYVTLSCRVIANPPADVYWVFNSRIISNNTRTSYGDLRYTIKSSGDMNKWMNLTINKLRLQDKGEFTCVAKSHGGVDERNLTLIVSNNRPIFGSTGNISESLSVVICIGAGLVIILIIIFLICCYCSLKNGKTQGTKKVQGNGVSLNGDITHHIVSAEDNKQEKTLTVVSSTQKNERNHEPHSSTINNAPIELCELDSSLIAERPVLASVVSARENSTSDNLTTAFDGSKHVLDIDTYPPDLIAFPGHGTTTTALLNSMNIVHEPFQYTDNGMLDSPVHLTTGYSASRIPHSRSQSPFSPMTSVVLSKQGYVTIPRRPRTTSSSSVPITIIEDKLSPLKTDPIYDNLGPRTSIDGSSILSLNNIPLGEPNCTKNIFINNCNNEKNAGIVRFLPSPVSPIDKINWTTKPKINSSIKRVGSAEGAISVNLTRTKIPSKPPTKSKKNGPLYEDDGEEGTEV